METRKLGLNINGFEIFNYKKLHDSGNGSKVKLWFIPIVAGCFQWVVVITVLVTLFIN